MPAPGRGFRQRMGLMAKAELKATSKGQSKGGLGEHLVRLHVKGKLSSHEVTQVAASAASSSGAATEEFVARIAKAATKGKTRVRRGKPSTDTHNVSRGLIRVVNRAALLHPPLLVDVPLWDASANRQVTGRVAIAPPHETLDALVVPGDTDRWLSYSEEQLGFKARVDALKSRCRVHPPDAPLAAIGLWGDGAPVFHRKSVMLLTFTILSGTVRQRFWVAAVGKEKLCQCGCFGRHTFDKIFEVLAWSFEALLVGKWPSRDPQGNAFVSGFRAQKAKSDLAIRACCISKTGDWAWYKQVLCLQGWRKAAGHMGRQCWMCMAGGAHDPYDFQLDATWRDTIVGMHEIYQTTFSPAGHVSGIWAIPGFVLDFIRPDWMHACDLGVLQHASGSAMWELFREVGGSFDTASAAKACSKLHTMAKMCARTLHAEIFGDLTVGMLRSSLNKKAKLRLKAAEGRHFLPVLIEMLSTCFDAATDHQRLRLDCLKLLQRCYGELRIWGPGSASRLASHARRFCILYRQLSDASDDDGVWALVPKFHIFLHCAEGASVNPALEWNYSDESAIGDAARFSKHVNASFLHTALMAKYRSTFRFEA